MTTSVATESANIGYLRFDEMASPSTPASGFALAYFKTDGALYTMDDAGVETGPINNDAAIVLNPTSDTRNIIEPSADYIPLIVRGSAAAQTKKILIAQEGSGDTEVFSLSGTGAAIFRNFTDSTGGFKIMDKDGGTTILNVDTTNERVGFGIDAPVYQHDIVASTTAANPLAPSHISQTWTPTSTAGDQFPTGQYIESYHAGSHTPSGGNHTGVLLEVTADGSTAHPMLGLDIAVYNASSGSVATAKAINITSLSNSGGGAITNNYGLYIEDQLAGTTDYSIVTNAGLIVFNESGHAESDIRIETDSEDHFLYIDSGANWLRIGDWDTNYTQWSVDGTQTMVGTARVKRHKTIPIAGTGGGGTIPAFTNDFAPFDGYAYSIGDDAHYVFDVPQDCDTSEDIIIQTHWFIDRAYAEESAEVNFQVTYRAIAEGETVDAGGSTATVTSGDVNIPATAKALKITAAGTIVAANISGGDIIAFDFSRIAIIDGNDPGGAPAKEPILVHLDIEYISNKLGENIT